MKIFLVCVAVVFLLLTSAAMSVDLTFTDGGDFSAAIECSNNDGCSGQTTDSETMIPVNEGVCFLRYTEFEQLNSYDDDGICEIVAQGSNWVLRAKAKDDANAVCGARCVKWADSSFFTTHTLTLDAGGNGDGWGSDARSTIQCSNGPCNTTTSFCGFGYVEFDEIDSWDDMPTFCDLSFDENGIWYLEAHETDDAAAKCQARCIEVANPQALSLNFNVSDSSWAYARKDKRSEATSLQPAGNNFCILTGVQIGKLSDDGDRGVCNVRKGTSWDVYAESKDGDDHEAFANCGGRCLSWTPTEISICGNGQPEAGEECDDGPNNGPAGNCSISCTNNKCENNIRIGQCEPGTGKYCKNFGTPDAPQPAFVPNCAGQNGQPACSDCGTGMTCVEDFGNKNDYNEETPAFDAYIPLATEFDPATETRPADPVPTFTVDGASGDGSVSGGSYRIQKGINDLGELRANFSFAVVSGAEYRVTAVVRADRNDGLKIVTSSGGESEYAQQGTAFRELSFEFTAAADREQLTIVVTKRGTYFIDDILVTRKTNLCEQECTITDATIGRATNADKGTTIIPGITFKGACQQPFYVQFDAWTDDETTCRIEHDNTLGVDGFISGMDILCDESTITPLSGNTKRCTGNWTVPGVPASCAGQRVTARYAAIWYNGIGAGVGQWITEKTVTASNQYIEFATDLIPETCGNSAFDQGTEDCDNSAGFTPFACSDLNNENVSYTSGNVSCTNRCAYDTGQCREPRCGNNVIEFGEQCDGTLGGATCSSVNPLYNGGTLRCTSACAFDTSLCRKPQVCGDNIKDLGEECDGSDFGTLQTCANVSANFDATPLTCYQAGTANECTLDLSACSPLGCLYGSADGICEMPYESRSSCPDDCQVEFRNVRSSVVPAGTDNTNMQFTADLSSTGQVTPDLFAVCAYEPGFASQDACISAAESSDATLCDYDLNDGLTDTVAACLCASGLTNRCKILCYDYGGQFYLYATGFARGTELGNVEFTVRSDRASFACPDVGLANLTEYMDLLERIGDTATRNYYAAADQGRTADAAVWLQIVQLSSNAALSIDTLFTDIESGSVSEQRIASLLRITEDVIEQIYLLADQVGG